MKKTKGPSPFPVAQGASIMAAAFKTEQKSEFQIFFILFVETVVWNPSVAEATFIRFVKFRLN